MKQKLLLKTILLLCALVVGGGNLAWADDATISIGINPTSSTSTSYLTELQEFTIGGVTFKMKNYVPSSGQIRGNQGSASSNFTLYNTSAIPGILKSITINGVATSGSGNYLVSSNVYINTGNAAITSQATTGTNPSGASWNSLSGNYFCISIAKGGTNGTVKMTNITITYTPTHTLTYEATNGSIGGVVEGTTTAVASGASVVEGSKVTLTATPSNGYTFSSWSVNGTGSSLSSTYTNPTTFTMGTANATVTANFVAAGDYITVDPTTMDMTSAAGTPQFTISTNQTLDTDPTVFYTNSTGDETTSRPSWITEALYDEGTLLVSVAANTGAARTTYFRVEEGDVKSEVITITQAAKEYAIQQYTSPTTAHGTITFSPNSPVKVGEEVTLTAESAEGYDFTANSWVFYKESGNDFVVDNSITVTNNKFTMPAYALYVDATFAAKTTYTITQNVTPANSGTIATDANAWEGKEVTVLVEAATGYSFSSLTVAKTDDANTTVATSGNATDGFSFTMPAYNVIVSATFNEIQTYSLITNVNQIVSGKHYIIVGVNNNYYYAIGEQRYNSKNEATNRAAISVVPESGAIPETTGVYEFVIYGPDASGNYSIYNNSSVKI